MHDYGVRLCSFSAALSLSLGCSLLLPSCGKETRVSATTSPAESQGEVAINSLEDETSGSDLPPPPSDAFEDSQVAAVVTEELIPSTATGTAATVIASGDPSPEGSIKESDDSVLASDAAPLPASPVRTGPITSRTEKTPAQAVAAVSQPAGVPKFDGASIDHVSLPNPWGKLRAIEDAFDYKWGETQKAINRDVDHNAYSDVVLAIPLLTGQRICDGILAIKIKDKEALREAANDIESLARKLGVTDKDLEYAKAVRDKAMRDQWLDVYTDLSYLQNRVQRALDSSSALTSTLVMVGGWMQGVRYATHAVIVLGDQPGKETHPSYCLREPLMVQHLADQIQKNLNDPKAAAHSEELAEIHQNLQEVKRIVDIDIDPSKGRIRPDDLKRLNDVCEAILAIAGKPR